MFTAGALTGVNSLMSAVTGRVVPPKGGQEAAPLLPPGDQASPSHQAKGASSSSVRKSTSSMTLPVSSPSSHSQFDDIAGPQPHIDQTFTLPTMTHTLVTETAPTDSHVCHPVTLSSPHEVEKKLDDLTRHLARLEQKMGQDISMILDILRQQQTSWPRPPPAQGQSQEQGQGEGQVQGCALSWEPQVQSSSVDGIGDASPRVAQSIPPVPQNHLHREETGVAEPESPWQRQSQEEEDQTASSQPLSVAQLQRLGLPEGTDMQNSHV